ncbi:hypothetical protein [Streptomyces sp. GESEQ-35]|uniref:hypothetical protein n=1 Tax=Streptomyces sp. GESEQ-35 TaxID=2812657 RepID=UPI001B31E507|nr:hypothetical protein [Streptomyces sp. GESEQ-35]
MITPLHVCRACDGLITDPDDAVAVAYEEAASGPGWTIWAHRDHVDDVDLIDPVLLRIMTRIWAAHRPAM